MEAAIKSLEFLLSKTENDVDKLSHTLNNEFTTLASDKGVPSEVKLTHMMKNVKELRSELKHIVKDVEEFRHTQQLMMAEVNNELAQVSSSCNQFSQVNAVELD